jgi:hypothetical protein
LEIGWNDTIAVKSQFDFADMYKIQISSLCIFAFVLDLWLPNTDQHLRKRLCDVSIFPLGGYCSVQDI